MISDHVLRGMMDWMLRVACLDGYADVGSETLTSRQEGEVSASLDSRAISMISLIWFTTPIRILEERSVPRNPPVPAKRLSRAASVTTGGFDAHRHEVNSPHQAVANAIHDQPMDRSN